MRRAEHDRERERGEAHANEDKTEPPKRAKQGQQEDRE